MPRSLGRQLGVVLGVVVLLSSLLLSVASAGGYPPSGGYHPPAGGGDCQPLTYRVRPGDTLRKIALRYGVTIWNLVEWNRIPNPDRIYIGQVLIVRPCATPAIPCQLVAVTDQPVYMRPSAAADLFGTLAAGEQVEPSVRTADGFYGFDPGVAQAGNVGLFRYRWVLKTHDLTATGACRALPVVVGPISNLCYAMVLESAVVYADPDITSATVATLGAGDYAMALGTSAGWVMLDLNVGTAGIDALGWIQEPQIGYNGGCEG